MLYQGCADDLEQHLPLRKAKSQEYATIMSRYTPCVRVGCKQKPSF